MFQPHLDPFDEKSLELCVLKLIKFISFYRWGELSILKITAHLYTKVGTCHFLKKVVGVRYTSKF